MSPELQLYFANWTLVTQIAGVVIAFLGVVVGAIIGVLGLRVTRTATDARDAANIVATTEPPSPISYRGTASFAGEGMLSAGPPPSAVDWKVRPAEGEDWYLTNAGAGTALEVSLSGMTPAIAARIIDLRTPGDSHDVPSGDVVRFQFAQRFTASGSGVLVVAWREDGDHPDQPKRIRRLLLEPAEHR